MGGAHNPVDGWMDGLTEISRPFQQYSSHIRTIGG